MEDLIKGELDWHNKINENFHEVDSQMADISNKLNVLYINACNPPAELLPLDATVGVDNGARLNGIIGYIKNNAMRGVIKIPPGVYEIDTSIIGAEFITIESESVFPRFGGFDITNIYTRCNVVIRASSNFSSTLNTPLLDFRKLHNFSIIGIEICGLNTSIGLAGGTYGQSDSGNLYGNIFIDMCSFTNNYTGIGFKECSYSKIFRTNIGNNIMYGIHLVHSGDSELISPYINTTGWEQTDVSSNDKFIGIYIDAGSGNNTISGGKIEENKIGIKCHANGLIVSGVQFDANFRCHIYFASNDTASTAVINGCRFLGGCFEDAVFHAAVFWIDCTVSNTDYLFNFQTNITITGNMFKYSNDKISYEYYSGNLNNLATKKLGHISGNGICIIIFKNNSIDYSQYPSRLEFDFYWYNHNSRSYMISDSARASGNHPLLFDFIGTMKIVNRQQCTFPPTEGSWYIGDRFLMSTYDMSSNPSEQICIRSGTYGALSTAINATGTSGEDIITTDVNIKNYLFEGDIINIAGVSTVYFKILSIDYYNKRITLDATLPTSVSNGAISFVPPVWKASANITT